ncbi:MAG TPA: hypothetical protein VE760_00640, partial [Acidimicrobiales bacterium]|nr:hypothetical protein [Acidimicrobiales bacterium]
ANRGDAADGDAADGDAADGGDRGADETPAGPDLVDALETIHQAVGPAGGEDAASSPPPAPAPPPSPVAPDLIGLGSLLGGIQEELVEVRQAVESLRREVRDAVALFQAAGGAGRAAPVVPGVGLTGEGPEIVVRRLSGAAEAGAAEPVSSERAAAGAGADFVPPGSASPNGEGHEGGPADTALGGPVDSDAPESNRTPAEPSPAGRAGPHEPTRVLPSVPAPPYGQEAAEEPGAEEPAAPRRSRRFVLLFLVVILLGALLAAGIAAVTVFGWDELESRFLDTVTAPVWTGLGGLP